MEYFQYPCVDSRIQASHPAIDELGLSHEIHHELIYQHELKINLNIQQNKPEYFSIPWFDPRGRQK